MSAKPSASVAEMVVRTTWRGLSSGHGRPRCRMQRLSHMVMSPGRQRRPFALQRELWRDLAARSDPWRRFSHKARLMLL